MYDAEVNTQYYGYTLAVFMQFSYLGCIIPFYIAGKRYTKQMKENDEENAEPLLADE